MWKRWGQPPWLGAMPLGVPPSPYKRPPSPPLKVHLLAKDLSPPFRISPWSRISEIHVPVDFSGRICCFRCFAGARARRLSGYPDVCAITDAPLLCGAGLDGAGPAGPDGLHHDLEIDKRSTASSMSTTSLTLLGIQGYVFYGCISTRCLYLVDRSWHKVVPIVGKFCFLCCEPFRQPWIQAL